MNISYNWLKDLIDFELSPDETARALTRVGLAVEGVHPHGDDFVFDVDLTSNRPDCLSHLGVARELSAIIGMPLKTGAATDSEVPMPAVLAGDIVTIDAPELCYRFTARIIRDVRVGPSPRWLVDRLEAIGERPINNVADITNYVMHELGQPMHAFDLDRLSGKRIIVRRARPDETITTLDEVDRKLDSEVVAICDSERPVAVGGVMGGLESSISESTVNVLLEVAYFDRGNIRATSRRLNLATEASYRFERGVDINNLKAASDRAADLICDLAGGKIGDFVDVYPRRQVQRTVEAADLPASVSRLTGLEVEPEKAYQILRSLGLKIDRSKGEQVIYEVPSWRHDLAIEEDLVEEVARHVGYENIGTELPPTFGAGEYQENETDERLLRRALAGMGFDEAMSYSFIDTRFDDEIEFAPGLLSEGDDARFITLRDSVIEAAVRMRPTILPGLLDAVRLNFNHQRRDVKLFEIGKVFAAQTGEDGLPNEQEMLAMVVTGGEQHQDHATTRREMDFYDLKGAMQTALSAVGVDAAARFSAAEVKHLRAGQAASLTIGPEPIGTLGRLSDSIAAKYKFRQPVYVAEINLRRVLGSTPMPSYRPLARYPAVVRDVSFVAKRGLEYVAIRDAIIEQKFELCRSVTFSDVYEGKGLEPDEKSITIRIEYRSDERTLMEDEVESVHQKLITGVKDRLGISPRP